jgi:hypothetical protein
MIDLFRQFMFTRTNESEHDQLRERLLSDPELSDQLRDQENDWIDAYAAGKLPAADAALLYQHLADTGQLHRIPTAAALVRPRIQKRSIFPYALACAAVVVLCFGVAFQDQKRNSVTSAILPTSTAALAPGTLRSGQGIPTVTAPLAHTVALQLLYQDTAPTGRCEVTLSPLGSPTPIRTTSGECGLDFHLYTLPDKLAPGRYTIDLKDKDGQLLHNYVFQLTR